MLAQKPDNLSLPAPQRGKISLVVAPRGVSGKMMTMLATLALHGKVLVIDGGNRFDAYALSRELRQRTVEVYAALNQVILSRVFTCYQMTATLSQLPLDGTPVVILDLLGTFLDESVAFGKRRYLLNSSLGRLRQIAASAPVALWVRTRSTPTDEDQKLLPLVLEIASDLWELQDAEVPDYQLPLF
jgi:hypothetical protein